MKIYAKTAVSEFLGDHIVYRNLDPVEARLPSLAEIRSQAGLPEGGVPRKTEREYACVMARLLKRVQEIEAPRNGLRRLIFVGDTRLNDATAFANLCQAGEWDGLAFIGSETQAPPLIEVTYAPGGKRLYLSNRWAALPAFDEFCREQGLPVDEHTAVVLDLDKTTLGGRGRNAQVIDRARLQAVRDTVADLLGADFDGPAFDAAYQQLNQVEFHPFTTDNQDYIAYICLILGSGLYNLESLIGEIRSGQLASFQDFIAGVEAQTGALSSELRRIHARIYARVQAGDPTPFKAFRRNEYRRTVGLMGYLEPSDGVEYLLENEIVITQEVRSQALDWLDRGALLFGLSDKPDEASLPTPELAAAGFLPIHRTPTHSVGE